MPEPLDREHRYIGGLDGLRAIAVMAVVAFHLGLSWAPGGLLGVGVFFTLSGYLITDLLVGQWQRQGRLGLGDFWLRRARRLLPALVVMLAAVAVWVSLWHRAQLGPLRGNVLAAAAYVSNWWLIFHHVSYFARFGPPSPIGHLWSLAVEEQFYIVWPWLLWLGLRFVRRRGVLALLTLVAAGASVAAMALLYHPGVDPTRVYDGTDTRAFGLLIGAALAMVWPSRLSRAAVARWNRRVLDGIGLAGLVVVGLLMWRVGEYSPFLYRGGLVLLSVATAAVVAAAVYPRSRLGMVLGIRPLRWLGVRSYAIYLWHYPILVLTTPTVTHGVDVPRSAAQVTATVVVAGVSWRLVEQPIRRRNAGVALHHARSRGWHRRLVPYWSWALSASAVVVVALFSSTLVPALSVHHPPAGLALSAGSGPGPAPIASDAPATTAVELLPPHLIAPPTTVNPTAATAPPIVATSSCRSVVHIGDSTSESLISADYLPDPTQRLDAQYRRVGATVVDLEISGARSIVETYEGQPNGYEVAQHLIAGGYNGCWVIALGTNDSANLAVGSNVGEATRIQRLMTAIGSQPVLWVGVTSLLGSGPYSAANMQRWDRNLIQACATYPNIRVYDWASVAQPAWFTTDGIHYTSTGSAARAQLIAGALATAFPASGATSGCEIS